MAISTLDDIPKLKNDIINESKYSRVDQVKFLKAVFRKFYLVHSWILCSTYLEDLLIKVPGMFRTLKTIAWQFSPKNSDPYITTYL